MYGNTYVYKSLMDPLMKPKSEMNKTNICPILIITKRLLR
jgi:hypothetical protein